MSFIRQILEKARNDYPLEEVGADLRALAAGVRMDREAVRTLGHYVQRLGARSSDPKVRPIVDAVNRHFVAHVFGRGVRAEYDPKAVVFGLDGFLSPVRVREIAAPLIAQPELSTVKRLADHFGQKDVLAVLAALAARTMGDLEREAESERGGDLLERAWGVVRRAVEGTGAPVPQVGQERPEARRPVELRPGWNPGPMDGWAQLRRYIEQGVPYEFLLLQRMVGTPFGTAQNRSSELVADYLSDLFLLRHAEEIGLPFLRAADGPARRYPPYVAKGDMEMITGVSPSPDVAFMRAKGDIACEWMGKVINGYPDNAYSFKKDDVVAVVEAKVASDGGTARQKCDELRRQLGPATRRPGFLAAALVEGSGWQERRAEVARLSLEIAGQIYRLSDSFELSEVVRGRVRSR